MAVQSENRRRTDQEAGEVAHGARSSGGGRGGGMGSKRIARAAPRMGQSLEYNASTAALGALPLALTHPQLPMPPPLSPRPSLFKILKPQTGWRCPQVPAGARGPLFATFRVPARMPAGARRCPRVPAAYYLQHFRCLSGCLQMPKSVPAPLFTGACRCPRMS